MSYNTKFYLSAGLTAICFIALVLTWFNLINFPFAGFIFSVLTCIGLALGQVYMNEVTLGESLFRLLVFVSDVDDEISSEEKIILKKYAKKIGIKEEKINDVVKEVRSDNFNVSVPNDDNKKKKQIKALVKMASADGVIDDKEIQLIKLIAYQFNLSESDVDELLNNNM